MSDDIEKIRELGYRSPHQFIHMYSTDEEGFVACDCGQYKLKPSPNGSTRYSMRCPHCHTMWLGSIEAVPVAGAVRSQQV